MIWYHLRFMGIKVSKTTPVFVDNISVVLNAANPGSTLNKQTVALIYHFVREHIAKIFVEVSNIHTSTNFSYQFTKPLVSNDFHVQFFVALILPSCLK